MKNNFLGCWAAFEFLDDFCEAIKELRKNGYNDITTHSPCPRHEIFEVMGDKQSRVPFFTLFFGAVGTITAYLMTNWMTVDWALPVSAKPLTTLLPYSVIAFEMTVLLGAYGTVFGAVLLIFKDSIFKPLPKSFTYRDYRRFTSDRFGLVVRCSSDKDLKLVADLIKKHSPEEIHEEKA